MHPEETKLLELQIDGSDQVKLLQIDFENINQTELNAGKFAVVSPGNSFGLMDGGFDEVMVKVYGETIQDKIQRRIITEYFGELPVGCALSVFAEENYFPVIIYAPTMQIPMSIVGTSNIYLATLAAIREAKNYACENILMPLIGEGTGGLELSDVGKQIMDAIDTYNQKDIVLDWDYALTKHLMWHDQCHMEVDDLEQTPKEDNYIPINQ